MTTVVVGGHSRKVGKTSVAEGLIAAFSNYPWTAIKISPHWHANFPSADPYAIHEEDRRDGRSDSSRFLAAGAVRSFWVRVRENKMKEAMPELMPILESSPFVIIEGNGILPYVRPDLYIMVLRYDVADFKESARKTLSRADAVVAVHTVASEPAWEGISQADLAGIPLFATKDPLVLPAGLLDLVRSRLPAEAS
jgi:hypothetical protein